VDRERYQHDAPLVPGYSMLLALAGRDVKPMSKPSEAWMLYRYSKLCGMLKYHTIAYFDPLAESVCSAFLNRNDFPAHYHRLGFVSRSHGNHFEVLVQRGLENFIEQCCALRFPRVGNLNVDLIKLLLDNDEALNRFASANLGDYVAYYELANFIHENQGDITSLECLSVFVSLAFAKHWMHKANEGMMDHYTFARPCFTYVKTVLEFYLEKPECLVDGSLNLKTYFVDGYISLYAFMPYLGDEYEPNYAMRATWFEEFIGRKKRHLRSLL
jgi:hypothetical protein